VSFLQVFDSGFDFGENKKIIYKCGNVSCCDIIIDSILYVSICFEAIRKLTTNCNSDI
jgi:hypothetical protein